MRDLLPAVVVLALLTGCYGAATPESCRAKYVRDRKGDGVRDTYEACLARAQAAEEGIPEDVGKLRQRVTFETGCGAVQMTTLEFTGKRATLVGANACGRRLMYRRELRRHLGMRSTRNTEWQLVADSAAVPTQATPAVQVNTNIMLSPGSSLVVGRDEGNPYSD
jgi:hypothetical protein